MTKMTLHHATGMVILAFIYALRHFYKLFHIGAQNVLPIAALDENFKLSSCRMAAAMNLFVLKPRVEDDCGFQKTL